MDNEESITVLDQHLASFVRRPYVALVELIDQPQCVAAEGSSGAAYQIEFNVFWDSDTGGDLRISGSIDGGGWRVLYPLTKSEIMKPSGELL